MQFMTLKIATLKLNKKKKRQEYHQVEKGQNLTPYELFFFRGVMTKNLSFSNVFRIMFLFKHDIKFD